jgi:hypothetical protein
VSEQNPSADAPEEHGSFGSAPRSVGSPSGDSEQVGSAPSADETVGSAPPPAPVDPDAPSPAVPPSPFAPAEADVSPSPVAPAGAGAALPPNPVQPTEAAAAPAVPAAAPAAAPRKGGPNTLAWVLGGLLIIVLALGVGWLFARNNVTTFKVGDCLSAEANSTSDASKVKKVDCNSEAAAVKVVGVVDGLTRAEFDATEPPCEAYEEAQSALWIGTTGKGKTYCLEPIAR